MYTCCFCTFETSGSRYVAGGLASTTNESMNDNRNEFGLCQTLSRLFQMAETVKCRPIYQDLIYWGQLSSLRSCLRRLFKLSIKRAIRQFHIRSRATTAKKYTN